LNIRVGETLDVNWLGRANMANGEEEDETGQGEDGTLRNIRGR